MLLELLVIIVSHTLFTSLALVLVFDYHPVSTTLLEKHLLTEQTASSSSHPPSPVLEKVDLTSFDLSWDVQQSPQTSSEDGFGDTNWIPEPVLWTYITQLLSALKTIHAAGLAARVYDASNIVITSKNRYEFEVLTEIVYVWHVVGFLMPFVWSLRRIFSICR